MKKRINFRIMLSLISLFTIVFPVSLTVVACANKETKQESKSVSEQQVVAAINKVSYSKDVFLNSKVADLKASITPEFVKAKLTGEIKKAFKNTSFTVNKIVKENDIELIDADLKVAQTINAKINYDYDLSKNQSTNLEIKIMNLLQLTEIFNNFEFKDEKGVAGFLDAFDLDLITKQIEEYLGESLNLAGLILENRTSNSIILKAKPDSKKYQGEVKLTWNLKLFEVWGIEVDTDNEWLRKGLKGYFYLQAKTNQVKYVDVFGYFKPNISTKIHPRYVEYHKIKMENQTGAPTYVQIFGWHFTKGIFFPYGYNFTKELKVTVESPELEKMKVFNSRNNVWEGLIEGTEYIFNHLGEISKN